MPQVSLSKALKLKNRQIKLVRTLQDRIVSQNRFAEGVPVQFDLKQELANLTVAVEKLAKLKAAITVANREAQVKINRIAELRGLISWAKGVPTGEGPNEYGFGGAPVNYAVQLTAAHLAEVIESWEKEVDTLQDEIDEYNATVKIEVEL